jgi:hypothetical protein
MIYHEKNRIAVRRHSIDNEVRGATGYFIVYRSVTQGVPCDVTTQYQYTDRRPLEVTS